MRRGILEAAGQLGMDQRGGRERDGDEKKKVSCKLGWE